MTSAAMAAANHILRTFLDIDGRLPICWSFKRAAAGETRAKNWPEIHRRRLCSTAVAAVCIITVFGITLEWSAAAVGTRRRRERRGLLGFGFLAMTFNRRCLRGWEEEEGRRSSTSEQAKSLKCCVWWRSSPVKVGERKEGALARTEMECRLGIYLQYYVVIATAREYCSYIDTVVLLFSSFLEHLRHIDTTCNPFLWYEQRSLYPS